MRLPYTPDPPPSATSEDEAVVARIRERRHPRPLQPLDLALLHSPPVADGWNAFLGAIRTRTVIAADVRELAISRVAVVNRAWYEWMHHAPLAVRAGVSLEAMESVKAEVSLQRNSHNADFFTETQWAAVVLADEMTRAVQVSDGTMDWIKGLMSDREVVELVATVCESNLFGLNDCISHVKFVLANW